MISQIHMPQIFTHERALASIPDLMDVREICFSPEGTSVAYIAHRDGQYFVTNANGKCSVYDHAANLSVGPFGGTTTCMASLGHRKAVPINGMHNHLFDWTNEPILRNDGESVAFWGLNRDRGSNSVEYSVFLDGKEVGAHFSYGYILFHPASGDLVYAVQKERESYFVTNGIRGPIFDWVAWPTFGPDGSIWYWGRHANRWCLCKNHEIYDVSNNWSGHHGPYFSSDGEHIAYWTCNRGRWSPMLDGRAIGNEAEPIDEVGNIIVSNKGIAAYASKIDGGVAMNLGGDRQGPFDAVGIPVFSPDEQSFSYLARKDNKMHVVVDGRPGRLFDVPWTEDLASDYLEEIPAFSPDGKSVAYRAGFDSWECVVVDNEPLAMFDAISGAPKFDPSGKWVVYGAIENKQEHMIINASKVATVDRLWSPAKPQGLSMLWVPAFSEDGTKVEFGALMNNQLVWRVISGNP